MNRWGLTWKKASGLRILCSILSVGLFLLPGCGSREKPEQMTVPEQKEMPETGEEAAQKADSPRQPLSSLLSLPSFLP